MLDTFLNIQEKADRNIRIEMIIPDLYVSKSNVCKMGWWRI